MIIQTVSFYDFEHVNWNIPGEKNERFDPRFLLRFSAVPDQLNGRLLSHPCGFQLAVCDKAKGSEYERLFDRKQQNYPSIRGRDGSCRVLECALKMDQDVQPYRIGFPLLLAGSQTEEHEFAVLFDGVYFQILCDGIVMDRDSPEGTPRHLYEGSAVCTLFSPAVHSCSLTNDLSGIRRTERRIVRDLPIQYYTPFGFNTWVGDVVPFGWKGRFHIFYLFDRRHHGSRRGKGAHEFWHLSTADFREWIDHGAVFELEEPWQSVGTGNAFEFQGKLHLSFGWHTERAKPFPETANLLFYRNLFHLGHTGEFGTDEIGSLTPGGASYAVSEDGIHFRQSRRLMHFLENPSIFVQPDGSLQLCQDGIWESDHLGDWRLVDRSFPPQGKESFARNCLDCPTRFQLDNWEYFMVGFTGFWGRPVGKDSAWIDFTERGWDPYDGSCVPMVSADSNGRRIEGGWLNGLGWGSCLLLREIIPLGNGQLGKRWIPETLPEFEEGTTFAEQTALPPVRDVLLEFTISAEAPQFSLLFEGEGVPCEFRLLPSAGRAQWSSAPDGLPGKTLLTFREQVLRSPEKNSCTQFPDTPFFGRDYAKENLTVLPPQTIPLRIVIHADPKLNATILDAEIGGRYTMASMRTDLQIRSVRIRQGASGQSRLRPVRNGTRSSEQ